MEQIMTGVSTQKSSLPARAAAATVADIMRSPLTTVHRHDHAAAAAYLMKHAGTTTGIRDAAQIMTASHLGHLPVAGDAGLVGVVDVIDVCRH